MNITILGTGHVGLPTGLVFAEWGHNVLCYDILEHVVDQLRRGEPHFFEPGVKESLDDCIAEGRISFTTSIDAAVQHGDTFFITVGTPPGATRYGPNGELRAPDMAYVSDVASQVAKHIGEREVFVYGKSTVPIQTGACVQQVFADFAPNATVHVASNPEFLQEGRAMENGRNPDRVVVGTDSAPL